MSEFRQDITTRDWVLISAKRGDKPSDFEAMPATPDQAELPEVSDECPFCEGKANDTPQIIAEYPGKNKHWLVRVVPNKFQALSHDGRLENVCEFYCRWPARGDHEVIFTYPHNQPTALQPSETVALTLKAYIDRLESLAKHEEVKYIHIIQNHGALAGASLVHPHSQIFTTPFVPERIQSELNVTGNYFDEYHRCVYCDTIEFELQAQERVVLDGDGFLVMAPYASKVPYQLRILPKRHHADFQQITDKERQSLAEIMKEMFNRLYERLDNPPYNYYLHTLPCPQALKRKMWNYDKAYHWHLVVVPRFSKFAGFELGTEVYVNAVPPEEAAKFLR